MPPFLLLLMLSTSEAEYGQLFRKLNHELEKFQIDVCRAVIKRLSLRTSPQTGVATPIKFADTSLKTKGIATPVYTLARNDVVIWWLAAPIQTDR